MKRVLSLIIALILCTAICVAEEAAAADPTVYPGIVAPLDESYIYAPVEALDGQVLAEKGLNLRVAPDRTSDILVVVPAGAEFKLLALYANGNVRVRVALGNEFYTGYFCTDMNKIGVSWVIGSDPRGIIPGAAAGNDEGDSGSGDVESGSGGSEPTAQA